METQATKVSIACHATTSPPPLFRAMAVDASTQQELGPRRDEYPSETNQRTLRRMLQLLLLSNVLSGMEEYGGGFLHDTILAYAGDESQCPIVLTSLEDVVRLHIKTQRIVPARLEELLSTHYSADLGPSQIDLPSEMPWPRRDNIEHPSSVRDCVRSWSDDVCQVVSGAIGLPNQSYIETDQLVSNSAPTHLV